MIKFHREAGVNILAITFRQKWKNQGDVAPRNNIYFILARSIWESAVQWLNFLRTSEVERKPIWRRGRPTGTVLYCTVLYCTVLYCTVLYWTVQYCTVLYCTVLYCTVLYWSGKYISYFLECESFKVWSIFLFIMNMIRIGIRSRKKRNSIHPESMFYL